MCNKNIKTLETYSIGLIRWMYIATEEVGQLRNVLVYTMCNIAALFT